MRIDSLIPPYTYQSAITIGSTGTVPVKGAMASDGVYYRERGVKTWDVLFQWYSNLNGTTGTGEYLLTLPNGLQLQNNVPNQYFRTDVATGGQLISGLGFAPAVMNTTSAFVTAVPYNATQVRILIHQPGAGQFFWGQNYAPLTQTSIFNLEFTCQTSNK